MEEGKSRPVGKKGEKGGMTSAHDSRRAVESEKMEGIECIKIINYKIHGGRRGRRACKNMKAKSNKVYVCSLSLSLSLFDVYSADRRRVYTGINM